MVVVFGVLIVVLVVARVAVSVAVQAVEPKAFGLVSLVLVVESAPREPAWESVVVVELEGALLAGRPKTFSSRTDVAYKS